VSPAARLAAFLAALAAVGGTGAAIGSASGIDPPRQSHTEHGMAMGNEGGSMAAMAKLAPGSDGTRSSAGGLRVEPATSRLAPGEAARWRFRIVDRRGAAVRHFERDQTKLLHLIVVRSDLTGYQHLHPALGSGGVFSIGMTLRAPGRYRAIADFTTGHRRYVLGTRLTAPGRFRARPLPAVSARAEADGYEVSLKRASTLRAGRAATLRFTVTRGGRPVGDLEPYLGAYGHLVALHAPELGYSHVHPVGEDLKGGSISFHTELPRKGSHRLFLQFRTHGQVHTAAFTQEVTGGHR
jgi:hypothetical protein